MDVFSRTFLPATSEALLPIQAVSRHMPYFRRCVAPTETTVLVAPCRRPGHRVGRYLLMLTDHTLAVTHESPVRHRVQLYLATAVHTLRQVSWSVDARHRHVDLRFTTADGAAERFLMPADDLRRISQISAALSQVFRPGSPHPADPLAVHLASPIRTA